VFEFNVQFDFLTDLLMLSHTDIYARALYTSLKFTFIAQDLGSNYPILTAERFSFFRLFLVPKPKGKTETRLKATQNAFLFTAVVLIRSTAQQVAVPTLYRLHQIILF
jgi:hypothetical protein